MIRLSNMEWGLLLTFTAAVACSTRDTDGGEGGDDGSLEKTEAFADAACRCWDLINLGDVYFESEEKCLGGAGALALGFAFYETECTLGELAKIPSVSDELACHIDALAPAIPCFEAIDSCDYSNDSAWNDCFLMAAAWDSCAMIPFEDVYESLYPACVAY